MDLESVVKLYTREQVGDATVFLRSGCNDFAYDPLSQVWRKYAENTGLWTKDSVEHHPRYVRSHHLSL